MRHGYRFKEYHIELENNVGVLYKNNWLLFKGERRAAMTEFVIACNDEKILKKFKNPVKRKKHFLGRPGPSHG